MEELEDQIKTLERAQEATWRRWSRTRWIKEGEMPSKFFFSLLKAKRVRESITMLKTEDGRQLEKEEDIIKELFKYYSELFRQSHISDRDKQNRRDVLSKITKTNCTSKPATCSGTGSGGGDENHRKFTTGQSTRHRWDDSRDYSGAGGERRKGRAGNGAGVLARRGDDLEAETGWLPLAPLLFSIATQPLMVILRDREAAGKIHGLRINGQKSMLHNLFADDSGVMVRADEQDFQELQDAVRCYESISGAKLNIKKSTVIPLGLTEIPEWLTRTGCHVARKGEIIKYLGFPIGWGISEEEQNEFVLNKLTKKLGNWKFRLLSFAGRLVALKHVIRSTPVHLIACLNLQKQMFDEMEALCRMFLWGVNSEGNHKVPLVAWQEIQKTKKAGGLTMENFQAASKAMRMRQGAGCISLAEWMSWLHADPAARASEAGVLGVSLHVNSGNNVPVQDLPWAWQPRCKQYLGWNQPTRVWKAMLRDPSNTATTLNKKWNRQESGRKWAKRMYRIWNSPLQNKEKMWTWRLFQHGLPLLDRMAKWGKGDGKCKRCLRDTENMEHLITDCTESQKQWHDWQSHTRGSKLEWESPGDFIQMFDEVWKEKSWAKATALVKTTWSIWLDRNAITFTGGRNITPSKVIAAQSKFSLEALAERHKDGSNQKQEINEVVHMLEEIFAIGEQNLVESEANTQADADTNNPELTSINQQS
ncbi:hypothetical protein R1sor_013804 [Riccia sorocarpa]|uniref:Reverse transcriptase zinc-binding domain-containing protein n=1 Tax=Riccia sorocarpa TaxID=122646 RepID=A0ABD3H7N0_9MARC